MDRPLDVYAGIDFESNHDGIENVIYERATAALENMQREKTGKISFYKKPNEDVTGYEAASSEQEDMIAEYIIELLEDEEPDEIPDKDEVKAHVKACIHILLEKVAIRYGFDRVSMSICTDGGYERYAQWSGAQLSDIPEGCLLNIEGNQKMIESKINFWEPYIVNDVYSYPDSSEYGRMVGLSSVRSFAQAGFECTDGVRVIVSFEFYRKPHVWNADEINDNHLLKFSCNGSRTQALVGIVVCDWEVKRKWRVIRMLYNSEKREHESISGAYVQAKIIRKEDKKIYLRIWNSGTQPAYNVNFYIPKGHRICVLRSRLECRMLKPGQAFDEYAVADEKLVKSVSIVTYWEDEEGCLYSMEQTEPARNMNKKICV